MHPGKLTAGIQKMDKHGGLEDDFPFQLSDFEVPALNFQECGGLFCWVFMPNCNHQEMRKVAIQFRSNQIWAISRDYTAIPT